MKFQEFADHSLLPFLTNKINYFLEAVVSSKEQEDANLVLLFNIIFEFVAIRSGM